MQADLASEGFTSLSTFSDMCSTYCSSEAQAETAATTIWEPAGVWTKVSSKYCDKYDQSKKFDSVSAAKAACASSTSCSAVYDSSCDGVDYMLCEEEHTVTSSTQGSCLYQRSGTSLSVSTKYSSWKYGYNKELEYLDRQKPDCGADNAMQSFQVKRDGNNLRYKTKCSGSVPFSYTATYKTSCTPMQGYELEYLERQNVACGGNQVLRSFKVIESGCSGYDRRYEYQCGNVQWVTTRTKQSSCSTMYGKYLEYLDRQTVDCGENEALVSFRLVSTGCSSYDRRYEFVCAAITQGGASGPTCTCDNPQAGNEAEKNGYTCTDGSSSYCASTE
jgi:hypothetical protein